MNGLQMPLQSLCQLHIKMEQKNILKFLEIILLLVFLGLFLYQSHTVYEQYAEGKTSFATNFNYSKKLLLPEVTVCPYMPDTSLYYANTMTEEVYNSTYPVWEEMWSFGSSVNITETRSYDKGRCWTMGYLNGSVASNDLSFYFSFFVGFNGSKVTPKKKFYIYVHEPGEAFVLSIGVYTFETISPLYLELGDADSGLYYDLRFTKRIKTNYQVIKFIKMLVNF